MGSIWHIGIAVPDLERVSRNSVTCSGSAGDRPGWGRWGAPHRLLGRRRCRRGATAARARIAQLCHGRVDAPAHPGPAGTLVEPCDLHSDRPSLRDLFPLRSEFAGEPLLDSAL